MQFLDLKGVKVFKDYVDENFVTTEEFDASEINVPQYLVRSDLEPYALKESPNLTGVPTAPTAATGTNTTQIATTAFVQNALPDVSNFITSSVNNLANYYLKSETYTKSEVQALIAAINQFSYMSAQTLPTASADTMYKIYLVPSADPQQLNVKDEFITIDNGSGASTRYTWEQIGSTAIDLSGYVTTQMLNTALADYTNTTTLNTLLAGKQDVINDLSDIRTGSQNNVKYTSQSLTDTQKTQARINQGLYAKISYPRTTISYSGNMGTATIEGHTLRRVAAGPTTIPVSALNGGTVWESDNDTERTISNPTVLTPETSALCQSGTLIYQLWPASGRIQPMGFAVANNFVPSASATGMSSMDGIYLQGDQLVFNAFETIYNKIAPEFLEQPVTSWGNIDGTLSNQTDLNTALNGKQATLVSGTNIKTINNESLLGSGNITIQNGVSWGGITGTLSNQTDLNTALNGKQATLVSGTNIKTINNESILGSGNISISVESLTTAEIDTIWSGGTVNA